MHSIAELGTNVPAFLGKLWKMVEDPVTNDLISWSSTGTSFVIKDEIRFARELLPMYYKHNNMASFIRQLNMYGFHKLVSPDAGSMKMETQDEIKFTHPQFVRGHPYLLDNIKRKIGSSKVPGQLGEKTPVINKVLSDVRQMKGRQESLDSRLTTMKLENEALWRELSVLRQKHMKQQQIVNKLIQFLVTIVQQNHSSFSVKRKAYPRMLQHKSSPRREHHLDSNLSDVGHSPTGPVIHELDPAEALLDVVEEAEVDTGDLLETVVEEGETPYFLNTEDNGNELMVNSAGRICQPLVVVEPETETIIGVPEDTLVTSLTNNRSTKAHHSRKNSKGNEVLRPKYLKVITKKPKIIEQPKPAQVILIPHNQQQTLQQQLNQNQNEINKLLVKRENMRQQQLQQQKPLRQKSQPVRVGQVVMKQKPQQVKRQRVDQKPTVAEQLPTTPQGMLQQTTPSPPTTTEPVITIPFDDRLQENVTQPELPPLLLDDTSAGFNLPVVVEVPTLSASPEQSSTSPAALSPQDILLGSPLLTSDPVLTPRVDPSPTVTSPPEPTPPPGADMQIACVDDTSPNIVSRSAHQNILSEMDSHIDNVQNDLDSLRELLRSEGISLDANALLGYFNEDPLSYNISDPINNDELKETSGNELMACNQQFDFSDLIGSDWSLPGSPGGDLVAADDSFAEVNTPQFVPQSPSFHIPSNKRKK